jgi:4-hydroxybenzoate polyprenyltransferase
VFCLLASSTYLINDILDMKADRLHHKKYSRPIANGELQSSTAVILASILTLVGISLALTLNWQFAAIATAYSVTTLSYSLVLKRIVIIDVMTLSAGYIMRAAAGALVIGVPISPWLYIMTGLGALLIGFGKRRNELVLLEGTDKGFDQREVLKDYSVALLDQLIPFVGSATLVAYILYSVSAPGLPSDHSMLATIPPVGYGLARYLYLVYHRKLGDMPDEILLSDRPLIFTTCLWIGIGVFVLSVFR